MTRRHESAHFNDTSEDELTDGLVAKAGPFCRWAFWKVARELELGGDFKRLNEEQKKEYHIVFGDAAHKALHDFEFKTELERPIVKGQNQYLLGFIDVVLSFKVPEVWLDDAGKWRINNSLYEILVEVKPHNFSIGSALRQIKSYRLVTDSRTYGHKFCLASPGLTQKTAFVALNENIAIWQPWGHDDHPFGAAIWTDACKAAITEIS